MQILIIDDSILEWIPSVFLPNSLFLKKRLKYQFDSFTRPIVAGVSSAFRRVASYTHIRTCVLEVTRKF